MILAKPSFEILGHSVDLTYLERIGRICYKSEDKIKYNAEGASSSFEFIKNIIKKGHETVIEHSSITVKFVVDRGVSHELVRHRLASFSQESTRYCNYKGGVTFIIPPWVNIPEGEYASIAIPKSIMELSKNEQRWFWHKQNSERIYIGELTDGWTPQMARGDLPNATKTEIIVTTNLREWRHILKLRTAKDAHPQMQEIMIPLLEKLKETIPIIFDDILITK